MGIGKKEICILSACIAILAGLSFIDDSHASPSILIQNIEFDRDGKDYGKYTKKYLTDSEREKTPVYRRGDTFDVTVTTLGYPNVISMRILGPPTYSWEFDSITCQNIVPPVCDRGTFSKLGYIEFIESEFGTTKFEVTLVRPEATDLRIGKYLAVVTVAAFIEEEEGMFPGEDLFPRSGSEEPLAVVDEKNSKEDFEREFYVIFNPFNNQDTDVFHGADDVKAAYVYSTNTGPTARDEYGVWFAQDEGYSLLHGWWTAGYGQKFNLRPFSEMIFKQTIDHLDPLSRTSSNIVYEDLSKYVDGKLVANPSSFQYDVSQLQRPGTNAQCASMANMLVSHLRSMGILSYPVYIDAHNKHHGGNMWSFHTWVAAYVDTGPVWKDADPFSSINQPMTHMPHVPRALTSYGKSTNDLIGFGSWTWSNGDLGDKDEEYWTNFKDNKDPNMCCDYPSYYRNAKINTITESSILYWVGGADPLSSSLLDNNPYSIILSQNKENYQVGEEAIFNVTVTNKKNEELKIPLNFTLYSNDPFTKSSYEEKLFSKLIDMKISPSLSDSEFISFKIPFTSRSDYDHFALVTMKDNSIISSFKVDPRYTWNLDIPEEILTNEEFLTTLDISNPTNDPIKNINATITFPIDFSSADAAQVLIQTLLPQEQSTITWKAKASEGGLDSINLLLTSDDGGNLLEYRNVDVLSGLIVSLDVEKEINVGDKLDVKARIVNFDPNLILEDAYIELIADDFEYIDAEKNLGKIESPYDETVQWVISSNDVGVNTVKVRLFDSKLDIERTDVSSIVVKDESGIIPFETVTDGGSVGTIFSWKPQTLISGENTFQIKLVDPLNGDPLPNTTFVLSIIDGGKTIFTKTIETDIDGYAIETLFFESLTSDIAIVRLTNVAGTGEAVEFFLETQSVVEEPPIVCGPGMFLSEGICIPESGGGCLIATATYGSELAPQVQKLRELRDNTLLQTESGSFFMNGFNEFYYYFSPTIADLERQNLTFKEVVKLTITPLVTSLSLLNYVEMDSEYEVLGYGISLILLNIGMYFVVPMMVFISIKKLIRPRIRAH